MAVRVLVVEDSPTQAEALTETLASAGYDVTLATSGERAIAIIDDSKFGVVISDVVMPGAIDGYELCRRIKSGPHHDTPVVLLTSLSDALDIIRGLEAGADNFFTKPYSPAHLLERLALLLRTREARTGPRARLGVEVIFMGRQFTITSEREQILDLLISTFEDAVRQNRELRAREEELEAARNEIAQYARSLESRLSSVLASVPDVLFSISPDGKDIHYLSPAAKEVFGCEPGAFTFDLWRNGIDESDRDRVLQVLIDAANGDVPRTFEYRFDVPGKPERWISHVLVPIRDAGGTVIRFDGTARDITERRDLEMQFRQAQKMDAVGRLAGGVAHDFNNLLTVILAESQLALEDTEMSPAEQRSAFEEINKAGQRSALLTRQLLTFSRRQLVEPTPIDLNVIVTDVEKMLRRLIGEDVKLGLSLSDGPVGTVADCGQVEQVIVNLAVNARDAMPDGGMLTIETNVTELDQDYADTHPDVIPGRFAVLSVSDSGSGMSDEVKAHLFEPFFTTKGPGKGTGLGLATCYAIAKQFGGHIAVYSEVGLGTTMKLYLPLDNTQGTAPSAAASTILGGSETVLLVEDDAQVRRLTARTLASLGYKVLEAENGDEALRIAADGESPLDVLVTDVVLPGIGGRVLAEQINELRPGVAVLFITGYSDDVILRHRLVEHDVVLLQKPFTTAVLAQKVREALEGKGA
ncbi:MAG TPA: response regulator [Gemmatimonadaceae bacterium]|nr:response regulator [Gemmatimonadaceae bacterium]